MNEFILFHIPSGKPIIKVHPDRMLPTGDHPDDRPLIQAGRLFAGKSVCDWIIYRQPAMLATYTDGPVRSLEQTPDAVLGLGRSSGDILAEWRVIIDLFQPQLLIVYINAATHGSHPN